MTTLASAYSPPSIPRSAADLLHAIATGYPLAAFQNLPSRLGLRFTLLVSHCRCLKVLRPLFRSILAAIIDEFPEIRLQEYLFSLYSALSGF